MRVNVFLCLGTFREFSELQAFVATQFNDDGESIPSQFASEVGLTRCEPGCIELFFEDHPVSVRQLLEGASYSEKWLLRLNEHIETDAAICVYESNGSNVISNPYGCGRERARFRGAFEF